MSQPHTRVLVTGGTGFVGSHIVSQLLTKDDVIVRAVVRSVTKLQKIFPNAGSKLEIFESDSLVADYKEILQGVSAVIHTAVPLFFKGASGEEVLEEAYSGTLSIIEQAYALGIRKFIVTGTAFSLYDAGFEAAFGSELVTEKSFGSFELNDIQPDKQDGMLIYQSVKTVVEKKLWAIAHEYTDADLTVILPGIIYGPFVPNYPYPKEPEQLGTNFFAYGLITSGKEYPQFFNGQVVDVRDTAKAHVLALDASPISGRDKRLIVVSGSYNWIDAAAVVRNARPEIADRLPSVESTAPKMMNAPLDTSLTAEVLGLEEYIPWQDSILAAIDVGLEFERRLKEH